MSKNDDAEGTILCIEDEPEWQKKVKEAVVKEPRLHVQVADTYGKAADYIKTGGFDVCTLDSRLDGEKPRLSQLLKRRPKEVERSTVFIALTKYIGDVGGNDRAKLFDVVEKSDVQNIPSKLEDVLLRGFREAVRKQAYELLTKAGREIQPYAPDGELIGGLEELPPRTSEKLQKKAEVITLKYDIFLENDQRRRVILLDCYGYVSEIRENQVEVALTLPNGREFRRIFDADVCVAAGVHFQDAPFRYTLMRKGPVISSCVKHEKPPGDYPGVVSMPEIDFSVFDEFSENVEP